MKFLGLAEKETQGDSEVSEAIITRELLFEFLKNGLGFEDPEKKFGLQRVHSLGKPAFSKNTTDYSKISALSGSRDGIESFVSSSRPRD